jgi:hypothetical protein
MPFRPLAAAALILSLAFTALTPAQAQVTQSDRIAAQSAIMSAGKAASQVARLGDVPSVGVVYVPNRYSRYSESAIQYRLSAEKNAAGVNKLRRALRSNPAVREALSGKRVNINRVIGVKISSRGDLRLYVLP